MQTYKSMLKVSAVLLKLQLSVEVEAKEPQDGRADADTFRRRWYTDHLRNLPTPHNKGSFPRLLSATGPSVDLWSWVTGTPQAQASKPGTGLNSSMRSLLVPRTMKTAVCFTKDRNEQNKRESSHDSSSVERAVVILGCLMEERAAQITLLLLLLCNTWTELISKALITWLQSCCRPARLILPTYRPLERTLFPHSPLLPHLLHAR